ncbi:DUF1127 domain-containing protein [Kumtagia ephedrae]|jgi:uncharacterized protein YjiS (DUF1127 family)|nr:DUF1127 domain-containing protein [Mesorhizobium ephedrae]
MPTHPATSFANPAAGPFRGPICSAVAMLAAWYDRYCQRRDLAELDDRLLADIGMSRKQALTESAVPFWRTKR